jgi:4-oxalomesaconate tautomerase
MQKIPVYQIRGGSSKGLFFNVKDLPTDKKERNELIIKAMEGSLLGDSRQIDGLGGANSLTSKVAIVSLSEKPDCDLDYEFLQVVVGKGRVSTTQTCGNILAGVLPFAIESGMIQATESTTSAKINIVNTGGVCEVIVQTPNKKVNYTGDTKIDGVVGTAAPIVCNYLDTVGATCGALLPTGHTTDIIDGIETTCIDNGMPVVIMQAADFGLMGNESKETLEANEDLKKRIEKIRLQAGYLMNLGDVSEQTIPKMCLISAPENGGVVNTRMFIPHTVHEAIGVLAAVSVATAYLIMNKITSPLPPEGGIKEENSKLKTQHRTSNIKHSTLSIEHPSGEFTVSIEYEFIDNQIVIHKSGVIRTARLLSRGEVFVV